MEQKYNWVLEEKLFTAELDFYCEYLTRPSCLLLEFSERLEKFILAARDLERKSAGFRAYVTEECRQPEADVI